MKAIKFLFVALSMIIFISCGTDSGGGGSEEQSNKPKEGKLQGSVNVDLRPIKNDPDGYSGCSHNFYIDVIMTGTEECIDELSITLPEGGWNDDESEYKEYSCTLKPGTYAVEVLPGTDDNPPLMNCCYNPLRCYTFDTLYGSFEVEAGETSQILPATIVPYQAP